MDAIMKSCADIDDDGDLVMKEGEYLFFYFFIELQKKSQTLGILQIK